MLASGSEVATLVEGAELLSKEGIAVRIVSVPSEGLFPRPAQILSADRSATGCGALRPYVGSARDIAGTGR